MTKNAAEGLDGMRGFRQRYLRLGAVMARFEDRSGEARALLWTNPSARIPVPEPAVLAVLACLRADPIGASTGESRPPKRSVHR